MSYTPAVGSNLVVRLPGEFMRCVVERIVDPNRVIIEISAVPMSKSHQYRMGDKTGARRKQEFGRDVWEALDDRDFLANRSPTEPIMPIAEVTAPPVKPTVAERIAKGKRAMAKKGAKG